MPERVEQVCDATESAKRAPYERLGLTAKGASNGSIPEYAVWRQIKQRCFNPNNAKFPIYGARGITMCERWRNSFAAFLEDMGRRPGPDYSIERRENNGNYEPSNCRWATRLEQAANRRPREEWAKPKTVVCR